MDLIEGFLGGFFVVLWIFCGFFCWVFWGVVCFVFSMAISRGVFADSTHHF